MSHCSIIKHAIHKNKIKTMDVKLFYKTLSHLKIPKVVFVTKLGRFIINNTMEQSDKHCTPQLAIL